MGLLLPHFVSKLLGVLDVLLSVGVVEVAGLILGWALDIGLVLHELLDAHQDLFDGDAALPVLFFVQDAQTHVS